MEKNEEMKFQKIIALLKVSIIDNLFTQISSLIFDKVKLEKITKSKEQILLVSRMYQSQKDYINASLVLEKIENKDDIDSIFRELSIEIAKQLNNFPTDKFVLEEKINKLGKVSKLNSQKYQRILMNLILNFNLTQPMSDISKLNFLSNEKLNSNSLNSLFMAESLSKKNDIFNSMKIFF